MKPSHPYQQIEREKAESLVYEPIGYQNPWQAALVRLATEISALPRLDRTDSELPVIV
jgi:hypothetical protein